MAIPILNHMDFGKAAEIQNVLLHTTGSGDVTSPGTGQIIYDSGTIKFYNGSNWISLASGGSALTQEQVEDIVGGMLDGTETGISVSYDDDNGNLDFIIGAGDIVHTMLADDAVDADNLASDAVVTASILNANVTTAKIADLNITTGKLAANAVTTAKITDANVTTAKIADDNVTYAKIQNVAANNVLLGNDDGAGSGIQELTKANVLALLNVENGATADQSNAEIRAAVEAATDSNVFTNADHTKLNGIAAGAQVNVSGDSGNAAIYDNSGTPTLKSGITQAEMATALGYEAGATADQTAGEIRTLLGTGNGNLVPSAGSSGTFLAHDGVYRTPSYVANTNTGADMTNATLLTKLAALQSTSGAADENIVIGTDSGDTIVITGNLQVSGTTTTVNSTTVDLNDHNITLDSGNTTAAVVNGAGITLDGGSGDDATFTYNASTNTWEFKLGSAYEDIKAAAITGTTGNFVDLDISGDVDVDGTLEADAITINGTATGDLALLDTIATAKIDDDAVTYAKVQNISATNKILGRVSSGAGVIEELSDSNIRTLINVADGSTANAKASEAEVQTGSNDAKFVTPLQLAQAKNVVQVIDVSSLHATQLNAVIQHDLGTKALQVTAQYKGAASDYQQVIIDWTTNSDTSGTDSDNHILVQFAAVPDYDVTVQIHSKENAATATGITYPTS